MQEFKHLTVALKGHVAQVMFNRPDKANALNQAAWEELGRAFAWVDQHPKARVALLGGHGKHFCAGIDLELLMSVRQFGQTKCEGRRREQLMAFILALQSAITAIEKCRKPVLAAIHNGCIGGGVDIAAACDMRYCTQQAFFTIKEIDMGMVADLGTLQRLPKIIPMGIVAELAYTGRKMPGQEAQAIGLANRCFDDQETMMAEVMKIAETIATKSPLAIRGSKQVLLHARDHTVPEGLQHMALWNTAMIMSDDLAEAFKATQEKRTPTYQD